MRANFALARILIKFACRARVDADTWCMIKDAFYQVGYTKEKSYMRECETRTKRILRTLDRDVLFSLSFHGGMSNMHQER